MNLVKQKISIPAVRKVIALILTMFGSFGFASKDATFDVIMSDFMFPQSFLEALFM